MNICLTFFFCQFEWPHTEGEELTIPDINPDLFTFREHLSILFTNDDMLEKPTCGLIFSFAPESWKDEVSAWTETSHISLDAPGLSHEYQLPRIIIQLRRSPSTRTPAELN